MTATTDEHRLMLHVALTRTGVPPAPGDLGAIRQLAEMDEAAVGAVVRWLQHAAHSATSTQTSGPAYGHVASAYGHTPAAGTSYAHTPAAGTPYLHTPAPHTPALHTPPTGTACRQGPAAGAHSQVPGHPHAAGHAQATGPRPAPNPKDIVDPRLLSW
ncbi:hypothetical protein [Wenjunlia tyrosinilytica]|uniref:Uncharacterized protein n=1 Tax=Wenjunlia tyrosinilytica TaxID=1544741 RepID=A0A918DWY2_9ACTN|nr:hypothetical protein [Wenjunlia tyrosinilytica]GGO86364.1 hypothetical protein GCM10012280_22300 [Wenjunlia tyrosinilytica]